MRYINIGNDRYINLAAATKVIFVAPHKDKEGDLEPLTAKIFMPGDSEESPSGRLRGGEAEALKTFLESQQPYPRRF